MREQRREQRYPLDCLATLTWGDQQGQSRSLQAKALDISDSGVRIEASERIEVQSVLDIWIERYDTSGSAVVLHCTRRGSRFVLGLKFSSVDGRVKSEGKDGTVDYYDLLQVSPNAECETIRRIHRMLAARYHPDNLETGDSEHFVLLNEAYNTLADQEKRLAYDTQRQLLHSQPMSVFKGKEFAGGVDGEVNRRLGLLYLLYQRCRQNPDDPGYSLLEFESLTAIPREHLSFAIWFLKGKQHIQVGENSDYSITPVGAEFLESHIQSSPILHRLLQAPRSKPAAREREQELVLAI
jgi:curved DNA-binding protein